MDDVRISDGDNVPRVETLDMPYRKLETCKLFTAVAAFAGYTVAHSRVLAATVKKL
jgi:hypothetical protein